MAKQKAQKIFFFFISFSVFFLFFSLNTYSADSFNPPYPRTASFQWGGARPEWYAKFDLVIGVDYNTAKAIKKINPRVKILPTTDWNAGGPFRGHLPKEWLIYDSKGNVVYYNKRRNQPFANSTKFCKEHNGKKYNEALPDALAKNDFSVYDGISTDGLWIWPYGITDIDLDRDGINDFSEHGEEWVSKQLVEGAKKIIEGLRNRIGSDRLIIINLGWGSRGSAQLAYKTKANGRDYESWPVGVGYRVANWLDDCEEWDRNSFHHISANVVIAKYLKTPDFEEARRKNKNNFPFLRYAVGTSLLGGSYVALDSPLEHYWNYYIDEFDSHLGYPISPAQKVKCHNGFCAWARFFDNGAVVVNSEESVVITDGDLKKLQGYDGPYYRFEGGQDPDFNNGEKFTSVTLKGYRDKKLGKVFGDAIILLKKPTVVVSDIYIDNAYSATSPGSHEAEFHGLWERGIEPNDPKDIAKANPSWTTGPRWNNLSRDKKTGGFNDESYFRYRYTSAHNVGTYAIYRPSIGVTGDYAIYEWHGWSGSKTKSNEATNVPYEIHYADGAKTAIKIVNQRQNYGQWNYLGTYHLTRGSNNYVKIKTEEADGVVIADALKFVYQKGFSPSAPNYDSDINRDDRTDVQDLGILLSNWGKTDKGRYDINQDGRTDRGDINILLPAI